MGWNGNLRKMNNDYFYFLFTLNKGKGGYWLQKLAVSGALRGRVSPATGQSLWMEAGAGRLRPASEVRVRSLPRAPGS